MATGICFAVPRRVIGAVRGAFWRCCWWWVAVSRSISAARWGGGALCDYVSRVMKNNTKIQNERAFCKKKREFLPTILRSENFALKVAKPFVSGRFSKGRKWSEIGRKKFENYSFFSTIHLKNTIWYAFNKFNISTFQQINISTNRFLRFTW